MSASSHLPPTKEQNVTPSNLRNPKKLDREAAYAETKALLSQAVKILGKAGEAETGAAGLETTLAALKKRKARYNWEAGRLLTEARKLAPHGTWTCLLEEADLPPVNDHNWRMLYGEFLDPSAIEDIKITEALALAKESRATRKRSLGGNSASKGVANADHNRAHQNDPPEPPAECTLDGFRVWSEADNEGLPIVHAVRVGQRGWTPLCRIFWNLDLPPFSAPPRGNEGDVNCPKCVGKIAVLRAEANLKEEATKPHGSDIGYVWEVLEGDDPDDINARWFPITSKKGEVIVTPEKTFGLGMNEFCYQGRREALESAKTKYQREVEKDKAEIGRLKSEEARLSRRSVSPRRSSRKSRPCSTRSLDHDRLDIR
jgi:hypothetical protein